MNDVMCPLSTLLVVISVLTTMDVVRATLRYHILEEVGPGPIFVGDVLTDSGVRELMSRDDPRFAVLPGRHQRLFSVDEATGILRTRGPLDRDSLCVDKVRSPCVLDVEVAIVRPAERFRAFAVEVVLGDVNDNSPKFDREFVVVRVLESAVPKLSVYTLPAATDFDSSAFGVVRYELTPNDTFALQLSTSDSDGGAFTSLAPTMTLLKRLDREVQSHYVLLLKAVDGGRPSLSGTLSVNVVVVDTNDNSPAFDQPVYNLSVLETVSPSQPLVRVHAVDHDDGSNGAVSYRLGATTRKQHGDLFGVDNVTGDVFLTRRLDADYHDLYELVVVAFDHGAEPRTATTQVVVHIDDVNGHPPTISINALDSGGGDEGRRTAEVLENQPPGTFVAYVSAQDADRGVNGEVACSVASANFTLQRVHTRLYKLATAVRFDREEADRYVAVLRCTDLGRPPLATTDWAEVSVLDVNDHTPQFVQSTFRASITETAAVGQSVLKVSAVDLDAGVNADVRYRIAVAGQTNGFRVEAETGTVYVAAELDYETAAELAFDVIAADRGTPSRSATAAVRISIINQNDCAPQFTESTFSFGVFEGLPSSTDVGTISAVDADAPPFNDFYYLLQTRVLILL